uniref:Pre-mRNA-splicing factor SYF2 n=1 Tax=Glossina pallidipes TaxID=7398 RepID=A0A1A9ZQK9_GLOPL
MATTTTAFYVQRCEPTTNFELIHFDLTRADMNISIGKDYDRLKLLQIFAIDAERIERKQGKKNPDGGVDTFEAQTARQYARLVKNMPTRNMKKYENKNNMVEDLEQQIEKRKKCSRRRTYNDDADVDYLNERNSKINKKLERFYGERTAEIKQNLERGTAI